jgi:hypothetical protein
MKRASFVPALLLALALGAAHRPALAQSAADVDAARELFREGSKLAQEGRWAEASERYTRSLELKRAAITLYSLGVAHKKTGHLVEALESFRAFLVEPSTPATQAYEQPAKEAVAELEKRVARVAIVVEPAEASVSVDGEVVPPAALGVPRLVNPGAHAITATARGFKDARVEVKVTEGGHAQARLVLVKAPDAPATVTPAQPLAPRAPEPTPAARPSRALPIALMAGGGAMIVAGLAVGLVGVKQAADAPTKDGPEASAAKTKALAGDVVTGVGIATAAAGLVVLLVTNRPAKVEAAKVSPWIGAGAGGVRIQF